MMTVPPYWAGVRLGQDDLPGLSGDLALIEQLICGTQEA